MIKLASSSQREQQRVSSPLWSFVASEEAGLKRVLAYFAANHSVQPLEMFDPDERKKIERPATI